MTRLFVLLLLLLPTAYALTLNEALTNVDNRTAVVNAEAELDNARVALARTEADPLALRNERVQARQRVELAEAELTKARYDATTEISRAYTRAFEAERQVALAAESVAVSEQALTIARIRFERGGATELDVRDAEQSLQDARSNAAAAREGLQLARNNLASLVTQDLGTLASVPLVTLPPVPPLDAVLETSDELPNLVQARQGRELARVGLELLDPSYAPQSQIDQAELQLERAEESFGEARRGISIQVRQLHNSALSAQNDLQVRRSALENAEQRLAIERQRLEGGLIAEISFLQTELSTLQARVATVQAGHSYLLALLELQAGSMYPLEVF
ncbi:MAG: TolC family protein [Trueperaceae bacterium]|nr:TolC family protein [Trueperaceae bacterium]